MQIGISHFYHIHLIISDILSEFQSSPRRLAGKLQGDGLFSLCYNFLKKKAEKCIPVTFVTAQNII